MRKRLTVERRSVSVWVFTAPPLRVLLLRRPEARAAGWQPVTGRVEPTDASLEAVCLREIAEETGLTGTLEMVDLGIQASFVGYDGVTYHQRSFAARLAQETSPVVSAEHEEARWVGEAEARALLRWDADREALGVLAARVTP